MLSVGSMIKVNVKSEVRDRVGDIHLRYPKKFLGIDTSAVIAPAMF